MFDNVVHVHFCQAAEIWAAYAQGKISSLRREQLLRPLRDKLRAYEPRK